MVPGKSTMESFWFDTPFGIALLGGIIPTVLGLVWLLAADLPGLRADRFRLGPGEWPAALGWLILYGVMMVIVSYLSSWLCILLAQAR